MINVLVADYDENEAKKMCNFISKDKNIKPYYTSNGYSTILTYYKLKPEVLVLSLDFPDLSSVDIIKRLSSTDEEKYKCNIIAVTNSLDELLDLDNTIRIFKVLKKNSNNELLETILKMDNSNIRTKISIELDSYLVDLGFHLKSSGSIYMKDAIELCLFHPAYLSSLDNIIKYLSKKYHVTYFNVRDALRASLKPFNTLKSYDYPPSSIFNLFNKHFDISTKSFIEQSVVYFLKKHNVK